MAAPFQHVLVATDGSPLADKGMALALRVASGSRVTALTVVHDYGLPEYVRAAMQRRPDARELRDALIAGGRRLLDDAIARAAPADQPVERRVVLSEKAACHEIVALAEREGCDLIVMASHGHGGFLSSLLGSQTQAVLSFASVPVLVAR